MSSTRHCCVANDPAWRIRAFILSRPRSARLRKVFVSSKLIKGAITSQPVLGRLHRQYCRIQAFGTHRIRRLSCPRLRFGVPCRNSRAAFYAGAVRELRRELAKIIVERAAHDLVSVSTLLDRSDVEPLQFLPRDGNHNATQLLGVVGRTKGLVRAGPAPGAAMP
jgi:hypothetical protein